MIRYSVFVVRKVRGLELRRPYASATDRDHAEQLRALLDDPARGMRGEIVEHEQVAFDEKYGWAA